MPPDVDPLTLLRDQLDRTEAAARELGRVATHARGAGAGGGTPGAGWQMPGADTSGAPKDGELTAALTALVDAVRGAIPPELAERVASVLREVLLAIRAVVDFALERMEARRRAPVEVQDIPIL
jgi:hypothetical protein